MKKYIAMALMPILLQGSLHADDSQFKELDVLIVNELMAAQKQMNSTIRLELKAILDALISFAGKGRNNRQVAINNIFLIQKSVNQCKDDQYKSSWDNIKWAFGYHPELVKNEIQPALDLIKADLAKLNVTQNEMAVSGAAIAGIAVGAAAVAAAGGIAAWYFGAFGKKINDKDASDNTSPQYEYKDADVLRLEKIAQDVATQVVNKIAFNDDSQRTYYNFAYTEALNKLKRVENAVDVYTPGSFEYQELCNDIKSDVIQKHEHEGISQWDFYGDVNKHL